MIKQLLNSFITKYRDLSVSLRSIICLSLRLQQIIDLLTSDNSRCFAQPRPIIVNYLLFWMAYQHVHKHMWELALLGCYIVKQNQLNYQVSCSCSSLARKDCIDSFSSCARLATASNETSNSFSSFFPQRTQNKHKMLKM